MGSGLLAHLVAVQLGGQHMMIDPPLAGQRVTLRFEGQLMHVISGNRLVKPCHRHGIQPLRAKPTSARTSLPTAATTVWPAASGPAGSWQRCRDGRRSARYAS